MSGLMGFLKIRHRGVPVMYTDLDERSDELKREVEQFLKSEYPINQVPEEAVQAFHKIEVLCDQLKVYLEDIVQPVREREAEEEKLEKKEGFIYATSQPPEVTKNPLGDEPVETLESL